MLDDLLLLSGNDIPFIEAQITIHQPRIKEIAYIGEEAFLTGWQFLDFSKNFLSSEDSLNLDDKTNFDILIAILRERNAVMQKNKDCVMMVLALMFPEYSISFSKRGIELKKENDIHYINNDNFEAFKIILKKMFSFGNKDDNVNDFNPSGDMANKIAEKLRERHKILAEKNNDKNKKIDIISRYVSILAVGQRKDINSLMSYTVYQLFDEFERYQLKLIYDLNTQAKLAGAKDLKEIDDWMKDIHSK